MCSGDTERPSGLCAPISRSLLTLQGGDDSLAHVNVLRDV